MNPIKLFKLFRDYEKFNSIVKEKATMNTKVTQIVTLLVTVIGTFGVADYAQGWVGHHAAVFGGLAAAAQILHALFPSIFAKPNANPQPPSDGAGSNLGKAVILLLGLLLIPATLKAQTIPEAPAPQVQNLYFGGVSYNLGATPSIAGTGGYAHALNADGTYGFAVFDALPNTLQPFTVSTNVGGGVAQRVITIGKIPIYTPITAGFSWTGHNSGWQWSGGGAASIHIKGPWYFLPNVRFLKSSVSDGTGYQIIAGGWFGFGK